MTLFWILSQVLQISYILLLFSSFHIIVHCSLCKMQDATRDGILLNDHYSTYEKCYMCSMCWCVCVWWWRWGRGSVNLEINCAEDGITQPSLSRHHVLCLAFSTSTTTNLICFFDKLIKVNVSICIQTYNTRRLLWPSKLGRAII